MRTCVKFVYVYFFLAEIGSKICRASLPTEYYLTGRNILVAQIYHATNNYMEHSPSSESDSRAAGHFPPLTQPECSLPYC